MDAYELAYQYTLYTNRCIFLTGKAGTGKTTFLRKVKMECRKQLMVVAPTGVAAINAEGITIHSLFQLPPQLFLPTDAARKRLFAEMQMRGQKQRLLRQLELLIIDEVSMVRSDLLDAIDAVLRRVKRKSHLPFGGVQVILIGDLFQLSPVAREEEWRLMQPYYEGPYFFQARVFKQLSPVYIELDHVFRQTNEAFVSLLNQVRSNTLTPEFLAQLNARYSPGYVRGKGEPFFITLSTHNRKVDEINAREMDRLLTRTYTYTAQVKDNFPESMYPIDRVLELREGARVMFVKNDSSPEHMYYNGRLGVVRSLSDEHIIVAAEDENGEEELIEVHAEEWQNIAYRTREGSEEIEPVVTGTFTHIPLRLAWAVTIHKAQGLTFDHVLIDAADAFASGQVYVALSRCRSLEGIRLLSPIPAGAMSNAKEVVDFTSHQPPIAQLETALSTSKMDYLLSLLVALFDYRDTYMRVEQLMHVVDGASSFNREDVAAWLQPLRDEVGEWQQSGERFQQQLRALLMTPNINWGYLTARLESASAYYRPRIERWLTSLQASPAYTDDKHDAKRFEELADECYAALHLQCYMIHSMPHEVSSEYYMEAKSHYVSPLVHISARGEEKEVSLTDSAHPLLLARLKQLRSSLAKERGIIAYQLASTKTLVAISNLLPLTKSELMDVYGFGAARYKLWGEDILRTVQAYSNADHNIPARSQSTQPTRMAAAAFKTLQALYGGANTIDDLMRVRHLSRATVCMHLIELIRADLLDPFDLKSDSDRDTLGELISRLD